MYNDDTLNEGISLDNNEANNETISPEEAIEPEIPVQEDSIDTEEVIELGSSDISIEDVEDIIIEETEPEVPVSDYQEETPQNEPSNYCYGKEVNQYSSYHIYETPVENKKTVKSKKKKHLGFVGKALIAGFVFGVVAFGTMFAASKLFPIKTNVESGSNPTTQATATLTTSSNLTAEDYQVAQVVQEVMPAVVSINCTSTAVYNSFFGQQEYEATSAGTGIIVGSNETELLIATNNHVVNGATAIQIAFDDESTATAVLKGSSSDVDLAVVAVKWDDLSEETKSAIKIATLGDSASLIVGEPAIAIGNSLGYGQSVTYGIVSALNREVTVTTDDSYGYGNSQEITSELIQTDAAINPGNSGGPLLNSRGEVIGINSVKYSSEEVEGMGYAIPISEALPILEDLMNRKTKEKVDEKDASYIGITGTNVTSDAAMIYGMPSGVFVAQVVEDGPAENAGMKRGDIITEMDGTSITSMDDLTEELTYHAAGSTVEVVVNRNNNGEYEEITLEVTLGSKDDMPEESELNIEE